MHPITLSRAEAVRDGPERIDENAALGLLDGIGALRRNGPRLVVAGITRERYAAFERFGLFRTVSRDDVWADVESALARAASPVAGGSTTSGPVVRAADRA